MNRATANASATIIGAKCQRIPPTGDAQLIPIQIVRARFIADPIALGIPERTGFESDHAESRTGQPLQQHAACRPNADYAEVYLLIIFVTAHGQVNVLDGPEHVLVLGRFEGAKKRRFQCVPP
jgi:hypothetical protein